MKLLALQDISTNERFYIGVMILGFVGLAMRDALGIDYFYWECVAVVLAGMIGFLVQPLPKKDPERTV